MLSGIRWRSIRTRVIAWSFVPTMIILVAVAVVIYYAYQDVTEDLVVERNAELTRLAAAQLATQLKQWADLLDSEARTLALVGSNRIAQQEILTDASNRLTVFDAGVLVLDTFGTVVAAEPERPEVLGQDWSDRAYYLRVLRSEAVGVTGGILSDLTNDGPGGVPVVVIAVPIVGTQGELVGAIAGMYRLGVSSVSTFYGGIAKLRLGDSGAAYLVDSQGRVIYHSDPKRIGDDFSGQDVAQCASNGETGAVRCRNLEGEPIVASYAPVPDTPWGLVREESWSSLIGPARGYQQFLLFLLVLGVVVPVLVVAVGVRKITRPIAELADAVRDVANGHFDRTITVQTGDEVEELALQFNLMAEQLQMSYARLEQEVKDRTLELATLSTVSSVVNRSLDQDEILGAALDETLNMLSASAGMIALTEPDRDVLAVRVHRGLSEEFIEIVRHIPLGEGISGQAALQERTIVMDVPEYGELEVARRFSSAVQQEGLQTLAAIPIVYKQQVLGTLTIGTRQARAYPSKQLDLLAAIGREIGAGVGHALLYASVQQELAERVRAEEKLLELNQAHARRNQELGLLNRVIAASTSGIGSTAMLRMVCHELALAFDIPQVGVALLDHNTPAEPGGVLTVVAEHLAEGRSSALGAVIPIEGNPSTQFVLDNRAPLVVRDAQHDPRMAPVHDLMRQLGVASMLILPLVVHDQAVGTIGLDAFEPRAFAEDEVSLAMNVAGAAAQVLDKTRAEEALRSSQQRLSLHVMHTPLAYIEWDADLRVVDWNPAAERIFGYDKCEALTRHAYEIIVPPEMRPHVTQVWQSILDQTGGTRSTNENVTKDGRTIVCEWYNTPLIDEDGDVIGLASLVEEVTERMRAEEALREARDAAESARRAAEAASRAKSTFLANMSHELRTPLNAILGFSQLMTRDAGLTSEQRENLEIIGRSGEHLLTLISDVLEMSKIEAGRTSVVETVFDLHHLLDDMEDMFRLRAMDKGLRLVCERAPGVPQYVRTDESKLRQVLINLLGNAVKFTQQGTVTLRVRYGEESGKLFSEVQDTGIGIAPEDLEKVFEPFVQAPSGLESPEGTGLGLPISRQFVRLLGGELTVTSVPGWGSTFKFDARVELAGAAEAKARQAARRVIGLEPGQPTYRLLVVEDREANRKLLVKLLSSLGPPPQGFDVREAVNGQEAVEIWEAWDPHLIWMDMRMPVMDGHEATKAIKGTTKGQATVIVALTATAFEEDRRMSLSEGCDDFVRKPFRESEIYGRLAKHLGVRYVYEDTSPSQAPPDIEPVEVVAALEKALTRQVLARLPAGWIDELHRAATQADGTLVLELVEQIREEHATIANALTGLVDRFRFDVIVALTEEIGERV